MKRAIRVNDTDFFEIQELTVMEIDGGGTANVWVKIGNNVNEDECDSELTSLQDQQDNLTDRVDELASIKELIAEAIADE